MICYRDKTFCGEKTCNNFGDNCHRSFTPKVLEEAIKWWGSDDPPIMTFAARPQCWEPKTNGQT